MGERGNIGEKVCVWGSLQSTIAGAHPTFALAGSFSSVSAKPAAEWGAWAPALHSQTWGKASYGAKNAVSSSSVDPGPGGGLGRPLGPFVLWEPLLLK